MSQSIAPVAPARTSRFASLRSRRILRLSALAVVGVVSLAAAAAWLRPGSRREPEDRAPAPPPKPTAPAHPDSPGTVHLDTEQQASIGLRTARVTAEASVNVLDAPGQILPDESQYAFITPRAPGVVRSVLAHIGQDVKAGDLLATIDSPEVGTARLELYRRLQDLEVAHSQFDWDQIIYRNTLDLIKMLQEGKKPEEINKAFEDRPVGPNRERLMTAYAQFRLATATIKRNRELYDQQLITTKQFQQVTADFEVAEAAYQSLMDQIDYDVRLANTRAQQALKRAETAVRAAREHLRILGVKPDGTEPAVQSGKVVGVKPDGTLDSPDKEPGPEEKPEKIIPPEKDRAGEVKPVGAAPAAEVKPQDAPISTYSIWAPFDGTILDRQLIVPGVAVDITHRIFTLANLKSVWVEAKMYESDFALLARARGGRIRLRSPGYPGRVFEGEVIYTGDLVEEQSRAVKLLARAENPDRLLKPGMFVEVEVVSPGEGTVARIPASALLTEGNLTEVFVRGGPDLFVRREVVAEPPRGETVSILKGLEPGDEVVVAGGFKLKSLAIQMASSTE